MKLPRLVTRRRVKWVGAGVSLIIGATLVSSVFLRVGVGKGTPEDEVIVTVELLRGGLSINWFDPREIPDFGTIRVRAEANREGESSPFVDDDNSWRLHAQAETYLKLPISPIVQNGYIFIPLWLPLLLIAAPTAYLWYIDRRAKPWQCATCRYDLRGLDGGVCPECGEASQ